MLGALSAARVGAESCCYCMQVVPSCFGYLYDTVVAIDKRAWYGPDAGFAFAFNTFSVWLCFAAQHFQMLSTDAGEIHALRSRAIWISKNLFLGSWNGFRCGYQR